MINKLHPTICHPELIIPTEVERSYKITKLLLLLILFLFVGVGTYAQTYNWKWAVSGGGTQGADLIYDVKVGSDNNYYFIGSMYGTIGTQLNGETVTTNNTSLGGSDIFLFSTTCDGQVRWSQAIGGAVH